MKRLSAVILFCLCPLLGIGAEYRAGEKIYQPSGSFAHWEVSAAWEGSSSEVSLKNAHSSSDGLHGISGRVLYYPFRIFAIGAEGTYYRKQSLTPLLQSYRVHRVGVLGKLHLSPDTNPRIYLVAGAGQTSYQFKYIPTFEDMDTTKNNFYVMGGVGMEIALYRALFMALEGRFLYNKHVTLSNFYTLTKRWEEDVRVGVGVRF